MTENRANDTPISDLYLILHKVRGFPSFDVAERISYDVWSVPTSGHRAYAYAWWKLTDLKSDKGAHLKSYNPNARYQPPVTGTVPADFIVDEDRWDWQDLRDHYGKVEGALRRKPDSVRNSIRNAAKRVASGRGLWLSNGTWVTVLCLFMFVVYGIFYLSTRRLIGEHWAELGAGILAWFGGMWVFYHGVNWLERNGYIK